MKYSYLYSIIELYLKNETDNKKANLNIVKVNEKVVFNFNMSKDDTDKASYDIPVDVINEYLSDILNFYKSDLLIIDEKYELNSSKKTCYYYVKFKNGRVLSFNNFSIVEINNIRNILYNIHLYQDEIRVNFDTSDDTINMNYKPRLVETGFTSYKTILFITLFFLDIFVISLWLCKIFMKG